MKHTCFQPPSHTSTRGTGCAAHSRTIKEPALGHAFSRHPLHPTEGQALCRPCAMVSPYHWSPSSMPNPQRKKLGRTRLYFPIELTLLSASYGAVLLSCSAHPGSPSAATVCFSCPRRTPAPNWLAKCFEGKSCACKQAGVMLPRSHAFIFTSSDAVNKTGNRVIFTTEVYILLCVSNT